MDSDPRNLDGSDAPSSNQAKLPPGYRKLKEGLKGALLFLAGLDKASLAMLKHDEEYRHAVQSLLVPLSSTPISEIIEQAIRSGLDAAVSHISTHIPKITPPTMTSPRQAPSAQRSSTAMARSSSQALRSGDGASSSSLPAPSGTRRLNALGTAQSGISTVPAAASPRMTTMGPILPTTWEDRLKAAIKQRDPRAKPSQDSMVSVYLVNLGWSGVNPDMGFVTRLNLKLDYTRTLSRSNSWPNVSPVGLQDWVLEAFTGREGCDLVLVCPCQTSSAGEDALLRDLKAAVSLLLKDDNLVAPGSTVTIQLAVASIEWHLTRLIF